MKLVSGGVGVSHVSLTNTRFMIYGNDKLVSFGTNERMALVKASKLQDGSLEFRLRPHTEGTRIKYSEQSKAWLWERSFGGSFPKPPLPLFGKTKISSLRIDGDTLVITVGPDREPVLGRGGPRVPKPETKAPVPELNIAGAVRYLNDRRTADTSLEFHVLEDGTLEARAVYR